MSKCVVIGNGLITSRCRAVASLSAPSFVPNRLLKQNQQSLYFCKISFLPSLGGLVMRHYLTVVHCNTIFYDIHRILIVKI